MKLERFGNGEGKCVLGESVRDKDVYILTDVGNYDITYDTKRGEHHMGPDEHYQDIKRIISAMGGHASRVTLIMPYLYQGRQDRRNGRESLDCAMALQELESYGINELVTFDAHEIKVSNAIPNKMTFSNGYATTNLILSMINNENLDINKLFIVSPDEGARSKAKFLADILGGIKFGNFDKRRDYSVMEEGRHPIKYHEFVGPEDLTGYDIVIVDDMVDSGTSMIKSANSLKEKGANRIFIMVTFSIFSKGIPEFNAAYEKGKFNKLYSTNLTYVPDEYKEMPWFYSVDCSKKVANIINNLNNGISIRPFLNGKEQTAEKVKRILKNKN